MGEARGRRERAIDMEEDRDFQGSFKGKGYGRKERFSNKI